MTRTLRRKMQRAERNVIGHDLPADRAVTTGTEAMQMYRDLRQRFIALGASDAELVEYVLHLAATLCESQAMRPHLPLMFSILRDAFAVEIAVSSPDGVRTQIHLRARQDIEEPHT